jgi:hypothetical protein
MDDRVDRLRFQDTIECGVVADIALVQYEVRMVPDIQQGLAAERQLVDDHHPIAFAQQQTQQPRSDITGTAGDHYCLHIEILERCLMRG